MNANNPNYQEPVESHAIGRTCVKLALIFLIHYNNPLLLECIEIEIKQE